MRIWNANEMISNDEIRCGREKLFGMFRLERHTKVGM